MSFFTPSRSITVLKRPLLTTGTSVGAGGLAVSNSSGSFNATSPSFTDVTNLSVTLTTLGRPVELVLQPDGNGAVNPSSFSVKAGSTGSGGFMRILRGATVISDLPLGTTSVATPVINASIPLTYRFLDVVAAGTYTYKIQIEAASTGDGIVSVFYYKLLAWESGS